MSCLNPIICLSGTKRKCERSDSQDLKRLRPSSGHTPSRSSSTNKRAPVPPLASSSSSKKVTSSPRGRHVATAGYRHEYYEERKGRRGAREVTRSRGGEDIRRRESQRGLEGLSQVLILLLLTVQTSHSAFGLTANHLNFLSVFRSCDVMSAGQAPPPNGRTTNRRRRQQQSMAQSMGQRPPPPLPPT